MLTDYKVLILTLNDYDVPEAYRKVLTQEKVEITTDDASKIIGTINALSKQFLGDQGKTVESDPNPMRRAVAFFPSIAASKQIKDTYNIATDTYLYSLPADKKEVMVSVSAQHMDGTMGAPDRDKMIGWLKEETDDNECHIITNVKVLSEGVDVPSLDAVLFLSARNSEVDVVQSVGRVMRLAPGKKYGYLIIPVVVPSDVEADAALNDNERYKVVWTVLNALRADDDRFNATINKIELNKKKPNNISVVGTRFTFDEEGNPVDRTSDGAANTEKATQELNRQMAIQFEQLQSVVYARMVEKVGNRRYWEQWAKDVAQIAERQIERIKYLIDTNPDQRKAFENFLAGLQKNINPSITKEQAIDMLAQHIITKPVFEALFEGYSFVKSNPVSTSQLKTQSDVEDLVGGIYKQLVEQMLQGEMDEHLGYSKNDRKNKSAPNHRNGKSSKRLKTDAGEVIIDIPRDRDSSFEPIVVPKHERMSQKIEDAIISFYAKGMTVSDIEEQVEEIYGLRMSQSSISNITDRVVTHLRQWQSRPLDPVYFVTWIDGIVFKVRHTSSFAN